MSQTGQWYVYTGEDKDAIAVAEHGVGPNGGWVGIDIAKMPIPGKYKTQTDINKNARLIAAAPDLLEAAHNALAAGLPDEVARSVRAAISRATGGQS